VGDPIFVTESAAIAGVRMVAPNRHEDHRGWFAEVFRADLVRLDQPTAQVNLSVSHRGVLRGLHFHHRQFDYWILVQGRMRVGLADLRRASPTEGAGQILDLTEGMGLLVPPGVAHGFAALTDLRLLYLVTAYFDGTDEHGLAWNDPEFALPWELPFEPMLSQRDLSNPVRADMSPSTLPEFA